MLWTILAAFGLSALAPFLYKRAGRVSALLLAGFPAAVFAGLIRFVPGLAEGGVTESLAWAPELGLALSWRLDGLSALMGLVVTGLGAAVLAYSGSYFGDDPALGRFLSLILLFMGSMLGLVLADNLLLVFVFWELTSIASYLLIGFRGERAEARAAAWQALIVTAGGGLALLAGAVLLGEAAGTYELSLLAARREALLAHPAYPWILALVAVGAFTKSAQFPADFWLPNAMAAPTPASAYLHAATMVKAGVYLLARLSPALGGSQAWGWTLVAFGGTTMLVGAWRALLESDLKRILAQSTVSVLGALTLLLGLGTPEAAGAWVLLLTAHALYKGALFLVAGAVERGTGERDVRRLSGLGRSMPLTAAAALLAGCSMASLPPTLGFLAKEAALGSVLGGPGGAPLSAVPVAANAGLFAAALIAGFRPFLGRAALPAREASAGLWLPAATLAALGVALAWLPGLLEPLVRSAALAIAGGAPGDLSFGFAHGLTPELALSAVTVAAGALAYRFRGGLRSRLGRLARAGGEAAYERGLQGLFAAARAQTRALQHGDLRLYLATVLLAGGGAAAAALTGRELAGLGPALREAYLWELCLASVPAASAGVAIVVRSRLSAIVAMGAVGYGVSLLFVLFGAPDLAMTQFIVESLTVILFVLTLPRVSEIEARSTLAHRAGHVAISVLAGGLMSALTWSALAARTAEPISGYFGRHAAAEAHGRNIVNVILVDFRAFDTLGEITVLAAAAAGVIALLSSRRAAGAP